MLGTKLPSFVMVSGEIEEDALFVIPISVELISLAEALESELIELALITVLRGTEETPVDEIGGEVIPDPKEVDTESVVWVPCSEDTEKDKVCDDFPTGKLSDP